MHLNILVIFCLGLLLTACGDSSEYTAPPEYEYDTPAPKESDSNQVRTNSLLDIAISAGSSTTNTGDTSSQEPPEIQDENIEVTQLDKVAPPPPQPTTESIKPVISIEKPLPAVVPASSSLQPTPAPAQETKGNTGFKELDLSSKEHAPVKVTTVKLDNEEMTRGLDRSQSLYSATDRGRFQKTNSHGTKIEENNNSWSCVLDNKNNVLWEGKSHGKLRNANHQYTIVGNNGSCTLTSCTTTDYIEHINSIKLCGRSNWRLPSKAELTSLAITNHADGEAAINLNFFPNTQRDYYWSATPFQYAENRAWAVSFSNGFGKSRDKTEAFYLRLVSSN